MTGLSSYKSISLLFSVGATLSLAACGGTQQLPLGSVIASSQPQGLGSSGGGTGFGGTTSGGTTAGGTTAGGTTEGGTTAGGTTAGGTTAGGTTAGGTTTGGTTVGGTTAGGTTAGGTTAGGTTAGGTTAGGTTSGGGPTPTCTISVNPQGAPGIQSGIQMFQVGQSTTFTVTLTNPPAGTIFYGCVAGSSGATPTSMTQDIPATPVAPGANGGCANPLRMVKKDNGSYSYTLPVTYLASALNGQQVYYYDRVGVAYTADASGNPTSSNLCQSNSANSIGPIEVANTQTALTVTNSNPTLGVVTATAGSTQVINCGSVCSATLGTGAAVVLKATPNSGQQFNGWSGGGCSGTASTCSVTLPTSAVAVTASFGVLQSSLPTATATTIGLSAGMYYIAMNFPSALTAANAMLTCNGQNIPMAQSNSQGAQIEYAVVATSIPLSAIGTTCSIQAFSGSNPASQSVAFKLAPVIATDGIDGTTSPGFVILAGYYGSNVSSPSVTYSCGSLSGTAQTQQGGVTPTQINILDPNGLSFAGLNCTFVATVNGNASLPVSHTFSVSPVSQAETQSDDGTGDYFINIQWPHPITTDGATLQCGSSTFQLPITQQDSSLSSFAIYKIPDASIAPYIGTTCGIRATFGNTVVSDLAQFSPDPWITAINAAIYSGSLVVLWGDFGQAPAKVQYNCGGTVVGTDNSLTVYNSNQINVPWPTGVSSGAQCGFTVTVPGASISSFDEVIMP